MRNSVFAILKRFVRLLPDTWQAKLQKVRFDADFKKWENQGKPVPPPHIVKQKQILEYALKFNCSILVETGTFQGDMVFVQRNNFDRIYSIELAPQLWKAAKNRFETYKHIEIIQGDSGQILPSIVSKLNCSALFWLYGHYSSGETALGNTECPIFEELIAIFKSNLPHVLLIDDARCFNGTHDYPTQKELLDFVIQKYPSASFEVKYDIIAIVLPGRG